MYHHPSRLRLEMRGSPSFSPEIRDAPPIPLGIRCPGYITPWAYHAAHAPRPGRTQDCDEIWRHFCLFISATDIEPGAPNDWYKYQPTRLNCHLIRCQFGGRWYLVSWAPKTSQSAWSLHPMVQRTQRTQCCTFCGGGRSETNMLPCMSSAVRFRLRRLGCSCRDVEILSFDRHVSQKRNIRAQPLCPCAQSFSCSSSYKFIPIFF